MNDNLSLTTSLTPSSSFSTELAEALADRAPTRSYGKGLRLPLVKDGIVFCYVLITGTVEIHRNSDNLLIATVAAKNIVGLALHDAYIVTKMTSRIAILKQEEAHRIIENKGLWETLSRHMMELNNKLYAHSCQLCAPTVYEVICKQLMALSNEPESIRLNIAAERYIREKMHVSRSSIMKILANLKAGGYIEIEDGRLLSIRRLPAKY